MKIWYICSEFDDALMAASLIMQILQNSTDTTFYMCTSHIKHNPYYKKFTSIVYWQNIVK